MVDAQARRVVIVEDDHFTLNIASRNLRKEGWDVVECMRFEQALDVLKRETFDVVLTDIFMPGMGGVEGIREIRTREPDLPIVAMSAGYEGMTPGDTLAAAGKIGADACLAKPFERADLLAALEDAIARAGGRSDDG